MRFRRIPCILALTLLPATLAAAPAVAQDAGTGAALVVDKELAKAGKDVWTQKMCIGCHTIGQGRLAGPDLMRVTERRPLEWLQTFLKDPEPMLDNDPVAKELLKEANNLRMPNMKLTDAEIMAVLHYIAEQSEAKK